MTLKLGAKPAVVHPGQPRLDRLRMMARVAPPVLIRDHIQPQAKMFANGSIGDCTSAGLANSIRAVSALNGFTTDVIDADAIKFYEHSTGYVDGDPATDQGGVETDVLAYAAASGYALQTQTLYPIWGTIDPQNLNSIRVAAASLGPVYLGVQLAIADQANVGAVWDTDTPASDGDPTPGSWGGHCLLAGFSYYGTSDTDIVLLTTWGTQQRATWRWVRSRIMEAHGLLWPQLATPKPSFLSVGDLDSIRADNAAFLSGVRTS